MLCRPTWTSACRRFQQEEREKQGNRPDAISPKFHLSAQYNRASRAFISFTCTHRTTFVMLNLCLWKMPVRIYQSSLLSCIFVLVEMSKKKLTIRVPQCLSICHDHRRKLTIILFISLFVCQSVFTSSCLSVYVCFPVCQNFLSTEL